MLNVFRKNLTGAGYDLDYLFVAETANGDIIKQSPTDKPKFLKVGSSFSEVQGKPLKTFSLVGKGHIFTINLIDGHFEVDGRKLYPPTEILAGAKFQVIYYRTVTRSITMLDNKPLPPKVKYVIGWQYNLHGKNHKWEMGVE